MHRTQPRRLRHILLVASGILLFAGAPSQALAQDDDPLCPKPSALPTSHYLYNEGYGWFDTSHFNTGRPAQLLADVRAAVTEGGGIVSIRQGLHDDITGFTGAYRVAESVAPEEATAVALGIYLDWSMRFEAWQSEPPQGLLGPTSAFAVEDLPSQYLGFVAAALDVPIEQLFACYLGPVVASEDGPPDIVPAAETVNIDDGWVGLARLDNRTFVPLAPDGEYWRSVAWPRPLRIWALSSSPETWSFLADTTWYLSDQAADERLLAVSRSRELLRGGR